MKGDAFSHHFQFNVPRHVIIEGPDGSGKTTLIKRITEQYPALVHERASTSEGGPVDNLVEWIESDFDKLEWPSNTAYLYDRHPMISEPIYGPLLRNKMPDGFNDRLWRNDVFMSLDANAVVVWCRPPITTVVNNIMKESTPQMPGVRATIGAIYAAYYTASLMYAGPADVFDYTVDDTDTVAAAIARILGVKQ
jgi:GTPase SAR1 family protein